MSLKITPNTLKKLEQLFEEARYIIRFEKGNFNSGYCVLEQKRVVVINKFLNIEGRITALSEILPSIQVNEEELSTEMQKLYRQILGNASSGTVAVQAEMDFE
ncbi:hypothetical protein [Rurimicrobium arvi]|uniref:Uncharacterized protein n=1 Tax=Rurimicrobium arvi TaxID=2049916 RepID=A0ABP8MP00_9BACT